MAKGDTSAEIDPPGVRLGVLPASELHTAAEDPTPSPESLLQQIQEELLAQKDKCLRALAELENTKRRTSEEIAKARKFAVEGFAADVLPVVDSLEATLTSQDEGKGLREGVDITYRQLLTALTRHGLSAENPMEMPFDPNRHQAISTLEDDGQANRVLQVLQKGYLLHGRVLRPALVVVSKAKAAKQDVPLDG